MTHEKHGEISEKVDQDADLLRNPYREVYLWIKGELMDMQGLHDSYAGHDDLMRARTDLENRKISEGKEIEKLSAGKTTLKSLFKSKT